MEEGNDVVFKETSNQTGLTWIKSDHGYMTLKSIYHHRQSHYFLNIISFLFKVVVMDID